MNARLLDLGDTAITVEFGDRIDPALQARVAALDHACTRAIANGRLSGVIETVPTFRSLTVIFDPLATSRAKLLPVLESLLADDVAADAADARRWCLPTCYEDAFAPDLMEIARVTGMDRDAVIELHSRTEYRVYMLGFLPGFPFMGDLPERLRLPRRSEPRVRVPAGSVAIATGLTAIYPWESPGGWHLLANCPVPLFNATRTVPALLAAGDYVRFVPVDGADHGRFAAALDAGELDPECFAEPDDGNA